MIVINVIECLKLFSHTTKPSCTQCTSHKTIAHTREITLQISVQGSIDRTTNLLNIAIKM